LPASRDAVIEYLTRSYRGIGRKSAATLVEAVGAQQVFATMHEAPERVREVLGAKRGDSLLEQWREDFAKRTGTTLPAAPAGRALTTGDGPDDDAAPDDDTASNGDQTRTSRGRRGGRRRGGRGRSRAPAGSG
jgi:hypothetical protein